jgi:catecholate siderophore receptor
MKKTQGKSSTQHFAMATIPALLAALSTSAFAQTAVIPKNDNKLPEVKVVAKSENKYETKSSVTATKTDTLLLDTPQAITVISKELIRDQNMQSMTDAVRYVPGVLPAQGEGNRDTAVFRGNSSTSDFFVDGIRDDVQYYRDFYNIESVEALKGSNAMIFGRGGSGGVINRVTKQAQWTPISAASITLGSWKNRRVTADVGQAIDQTFAFRVTGMKENSESFRNGSTINRAGINPTLAIRAGNNTSIVLGYEHFRDDRIADRGIPSFQGKPLNIDNATFFGNAALSPTWVRVNAFSALVDHDLGNGMSLRNRTRIADYDKFYQNIYPGAVNATATTVSLSGYSVGTQRKNIFNQTDLTFDINTGSIKHKFLSGVELGQQTTDNMRLTTYFPGVSATATSINVPVSNPYTNNVVFKQAAKDADNHGVAKVAAVYIQDQIEFSPQWQAIVGLRYDRFEMDFKNNRTGEKLNVTDTPISPRAGLIFKPMPEMSIYGNYSIAFAPRAGEQLSSLSATNKAFDPEKFTNLELGAKWDVRKDLSLSAAVYKLNRSNVVITDPSDVTKSILVDGQRTQGVELAITGKLSQDWSVMGGYAYQDGEITRALSSSEKAGAQLPHIPTHSASLWNRYDVNSTWGFAAGVIYRGKIFASTDNTVSLPGFTRFDAAAFYTVNKNINLQLNIENLGNKTYYSSAHNNNNIMPGSPRALRLSMNVKF